MRNVLFIIAFVLLPGCSTMTLKKGDLEFRHTTLFQDNSIEGLEAQGVNGMDIKLNKHNTDARQELLNALLEAML